MLGNKLVPFVTKLPSLTFNLSKFEELSWWVSSGTQYKYPENIFLVPVCKNRWEMVGMRMFGVPVCRNSYAISG